MFFYSASAKIGQINEGEVDLACGTRGRTIVVERLGLPGGLFPSDFPTKTLYTLLLSHMRATCPAHLVLLDFITLTILSEE